MSLPSVGERQGFPNPLIHDMRVLDCSSQGSSVPSFISLGEILPHNCESLGNFGHVSVLDGNQDRVSGEE